MRLCVCFVFYFLILSIQEEYVLLSGSLQCGDTSIVPLTIYLATPQSQEITRVLGASSSDTASSHEKQQAVAQALNVITASKVDVPKRFKPSGTKNRPVLDLTENFDIGRSCADIKAKQHAIKSGIYHVHPSTLVEGPWKVFCDMETDGGGWTVFQTRDDFEPKENFARRYRDYEVGFGNFDREFWLGNILLWAHTNDLHGGLIQSYELAIDLESFEHEKRSAHFSTFRIGSKHEGYKLACGGYSGDATDSFSLHDKETFVTIDRDKNNCASQYKGGWWYGKCHFSNLNGLYHRGNHTSFADGINWRTWKGYNYSLKRTVMRFRPKGFPSLLTGGKPTVVQRKESILDLVRN